MLAVLKFFLGQDEAEDGSDDEGGGPDDDADKARAPSKEEIYKAYNTVSEEQQGLACLLLLSFFLLFIKAYNMVRN